VGVGEGVGDGEGDGSGQGPIESPCSPVPNRGAPTVIVGVVRIAGRNVADGHLLDPDLVTPSPFSMAADVPAAGVRPILAARHGPQRAGHDGQRHPPETTTLALHADSSCLL
jgi:hypothetical protein